MSALIALSHLSLGDVGAVEAEEADEHRRVGPQQRGETGDKKDDPLDRVDAPARVEDRLDRQPRVRRLVVSYPPNLRSGVPGGAFEWERRWRPLGLGLGFGGLLLIGLAMLCLSKKKSSTSTRGADVENEMVKTGAAMS